MALHEERYTPAKVESRDALESEDTADEIEVIDAKTEP